MIPSRPALALSAFCVVLATMLAASALAGPRPRQNAPECVLDECGHPDDQVQQNGYSGARYGNSGRPQPRGGSVPGSFDFYVLSLSWSPGFCATGGAEKARSQCQSGSNLGFVVHGLWPQYERGFPSDCGGNPSPSRLALDGAKGLFPDENLARYEWRKHGTCSGKSPADYFADVRRARQLVTVPEEFAKVTAADTRSARDIRELFGKANERLRPGMMAVVCSQETLQEVRICLSKDLRDFRACPEVVRQGCRSAQMSIPAPR